MLVTSRLDTTQHVRRVEPMHSGCVELVEQHGSTRSTRRARLARVERSASRDECVERIEPCYSNMADDEQGIVLACISLVVFIILFVSSNKINLINVYSSKLVNNLHIITLYKLHNELSCESRLSRCRVERVEPVVLDVLSESSPSCHACRAVLFDKLDTAKMHGLDTSNVASRVVSRHEEPSGIWAYTSRTWACREYYVKESYFTRKKTKSQK